MGGATPGDYPGFNHATFVVATALVFPLAALGAILLVVLPIAANREAAGTTLSMILVFLVVFGFPLAAIPCYAWIAARIIARHPAECWPPDTLGKGDSENAWPANPPVEKR